MFGERGRAQNRRRQANEHTQWMSFWLTLRPLQFYLHLNNLDVTRYMEQIV
jgi:hypothetical protein